MPTRGPRERATRIGRGSKTTWPKTTSRQSRQVLVSGGRGNPMSTTGRPLIPNKQSCWRDMLCSRARHGLKSWPRSLFTPQRLVGWIMDAQLQLCADRPRWKLRFGKCFVQAEPKTTGGDHSREVALERGRWQQAKEWVEQGDRSKNRSCLLHQRCINPKRSVAGRGIQLHDSPARVKGTFWKSGPC